MGMENLGGKARVHYCQSIKKFSCHHHFMSVMFFFFLILSWSFLFSLLWFKIHINSMASTNTTKVKQYPRYKSRKCTQEYTADLTHLHLHNITTGVCMVDTSLN